MRMKNKGFTLPIPIWAIIIIVYLLIGLIISLYVKYGGGFDQYGNPIWFDMLTWPLKVLGL
jgi:hypothetical protein